MAFIRAVAAALVNDFGPGITSAIDQMLAGAEVPKSERKRGFSDAIHFAADISVVATFLISIAPLIKDQARLTSDRSFIRNVILKRTDRPHNLTSDAADKIINTTIEKASLDPK